MIYITGDTHRNFPVLFLGDKGINGFGKEQDRRLKRALSRLPITLFCIRGNHEERPENIPGYAETLWQGGTVFVEPEFPHLFFCERRGDL